MTIGLVINVQKNIYNVKTEEGIIRCNLRGKLLKNRERVNNPVVVGDNVEVKITGKELGIIESVGERKSKFFRKGAGKREFEQIIVSNVDQVIIVCSVKDPVYKLKGIDRYVSAAESGNVIPVICFNKVDLINIEDLKDDIEYYRKNGYKVICTSSTMKNGIDELKDVLKDKMSVFSGSSGVGKSSLVNTIKEEYMAKIGNVSDIYHKGKHTTTSSQIYELTFGGMIIDTPGMREFGLLNSGDGVENAFSDIQELSQSCKFSNCRHISEPKCAVKEAVENGELEKTKYESFIKLNKKSA